VCSIRTGTRIGGESTVEAFASLRGASELLAESLDRPRSMQLVPVNATDDECTSSCEAPREETPATQIDNPT
jgi:hypothetical protein